MRSLRFRLVLWNSLTLFTVVILTLLGLRAALWITVLQELDDRLIEDTKATRLIIERFYPNDSLIHQELELNAEGHAISEWFVQLLDGTGNVIWQTKETPDLPPLRSVPMSGPSTFTIDDIRLHQARVDLPDCPVKMVRVGSTLGHLAEDLTQLTRMIIVSGGSIALIAPMVGFLLASRAISPLAEIIHTTSHLNADNIDERLPIRNTGDELDKLSITINGFLNRIATYIRQNRDYIAYAAHELRSPLTALQSSVEVALNADRTVDEYKELLVLLSEISEDLRHLVNQMLLLSESSFGNLPEDPNGVRIDEVIRRSLNMFEGAAENAQLNLQVGRLDEVSVRGGKSYLSQVVNNLIDNAIKYTEPEGRVWVSLRAQPHLSQAVFEVVDTGIGLTEKELPRIFERFFQADPARTRSGRKQGTGLGLSICQSILAAYDGRIDVHSRPGEGTRMTVTLPIFQPGTHATGSSERALHFH